MIAAAPIKPGLEPGAPARTATPGRRMEDER